jgi:protease YdgD
MTSRCPGGLGARWPRRYDIGVTRNSPKTRLRPACSAARALALIAAFGAAPARAAPDRPDIATLAAVGWLGWSDIAGTHGKGCTGVLVAPDLVLTAAHCVTPDETRAPTDPSHILFAAGWQAGTAIAVRHAAAVTLPAPRTLLGGRLHLDMALVRLDAAIPDMAPVPLAAPDIATDTPATTVGYPQTAPDTPLMISCTVRLTDPTGLGLDCAAVPGFSGGPVLVWQADAWHLAAIIVGRGRSADPVGTYAVTLPDDLRTLIDPH